MDDSPAYRLHRLVFALDRAADKLLRVHVGISYKRALFLVALQHHEARTQHELAVALGYSDPAVSTMLLELVKDGYVSITQSQAHGRKRLVAITPAGSELITKGRELLDAQFGLLMVSAGVDAPHYAALTDQIYHALMTTLPKEQS
jgi:DNA-binding MarR family transcriptional regulator